MDISAVRQAMASALSGVAGVQANAYALSSPTPPGFQILPPGVTYDRAMARGLDVWTFVVQGFVPFGTDQGSQQLLDALCAPTGSQSVKTLLESDATLGGLVQDVWVMSQSPGRQVDRTDGTSLLLVEWQVQVYGN